jgi:hypothetical protein
MAWVCWLVKKKLNSGVINKKAASKPGGFFSEQAINLWFSCPDYAQSGQPSIALV